jgi:hypothetical protein
MNDLQNVLVSSLVPSLLLGGVFSGLVACSGSQPAPATTSDDLSTGNGASATAVATASGAPRPAPSTTSPPSTSGSSSKSGGTASGDTTPTGTGDDDDDNGGSTESGAAKELACLSTCMSATTKSKKFYDTANNCLDACDVNDQNCQDNCSAKFKQDCANDPNSCEKFKACDDTCAPLCGAECN